MPVTTPTARFKLRRPAAILVTALFASVLTIGGAVTAQAVPFDPALQSSATTVTSGGSITLTATAFPPGESLEFTFDGTPLTTYPVNGNVVAADADGKYEGTATIPAGLNPGDHLITAAHYGTINYGAFVSVTVVAQPSSSVAPTSQPLSDYLQNGVAATFTGFAPGTTVSFGISTPGTGDQAGPDAVADANGAVSMRFVPEAGTNYANAGTYNLSAFADAGAIRAAPLSFTVTADTAVTTPAPTPVAGPATPVKRAATFTG